MKLFYDHRGVVTVFVTIILIPSILLTGFMVDLARIKCYQSQAVMAAESYANSVMSNYNLLLKDLYGIFAVTGDEEGMEAVETLAKLSFNPESEDYVSDDRFANIDKLLGFTGAKLTTGFAPYASGDINFSFSKVNGYTLDNWQALSNQITEYMKFRGPVVLAKTMFSDSDSNISTSGLEELMGMLDDSGEDSTVIAYRDAINEATKACVEALCVYASCAIMFEYYKDGAGTILSMSAPEDSYLELLASYDAIFTNAAEDISLCNEIIDFYKGEYGEETPTDPADAEIYGKAVWLLQVIREGGADEAIEIKWHGKESSSMIYGYKACEIYNAYKAALQEPKDHVINEEGMGSPKELIYKPIVDNNLLNKAASQLITQIDAIRTKKTELDNYISSMDKTKSSYEFACGVQEEIEQYTRDLLDMDYDFSGCASAITDSATKIGNFLYESNGPEMDGTIISAAFDLLKTDSPSSDYLSNALTASGRLDCFTKAYYLSEKDSDFYKFLSNLKQNSGSDGDGKTKEEKESEEKQEQANRDLENLINSSNEYKIPDAIWNQFKDSNAKHPNNSFLAMIKSAGNTIASLSLTNCINNLTNYILVMGYDLSMFSCATTDIEYDEEQRKSLTLTGDARVETLTGYAMQDIAYLYQGELEYIYAANQSASENQETFMWQLAGIRGALNFASTYKIEAVNAAISTIASAANVIPGVGLVVSGALRIGIAAIETVQEMRIFLGGGEIVFFKTELDQLESYQTIASWIKINNQEVGNKNDKSLKFSYKDYLTLFIICAVPFETIVARTGNLIELNVTYKDVGNRDFSDLTFKLDNAATLIQANCSVKFSPLFINGDIGFDSVSEDVGEIEQYFSRGYTYSVTRGY